MKKNKSSTIPSLSICIFLLSVSFIILNPAFKAHAEPFPSMEEESFPSMEEESFPSFEDEAIEAADLADESLPSIINDAKGKSEYTAEPFPSLKNAPIEELERAAEACPPEKRAKFSITTHPEAFKLWPNQKVLISWWINNQKDERWIFPVYLRENDKESGEEVSPIWMQSVSSSDLPEGLNTYYLTTYCGVAKIEIAKAPRPEITSYPIFVMGGDTIQITGKHFNHWDPLLLREVSINEQGGSRALKIEEWSDTEITVTLPEDLYSGRQKIYVTSGKTKRRSRRSEELPMIVSNQESFSSLTMASLLGDIFSKMNIHLNNYGPQRSGSRLIEDDAYISFNKKPDTERFFLFIPEYNLPVDPSAEKETGYLEITPYSYYINDLNMDYVTVNKLSDGWSMTFYFENIDDELIGVDTENTDIRAYIPVNERPLNLQINDLKVVMDFDLIAFDGNMVVSPKNVKSFGSLTGSDKGCLFNERDMCKELSNIFEQDLLGQLSEIMELAISEQSTRNLFAEAVEPWLASYSMGEIVRVSHENEEIIMSYLPRRESRRNNNNLISVE